ncbi:hypothetical protein ABXT08_12360 [Chryseobacterium sp. NRRL B-14859]|uniref:hypothetical protein n=1 Tax=Chryseobacterium sp. NRRL B-14859 TaxID=1562763 RepID=UPI0033915AE4
MEERVQSASNDGQNGLGYRFFNFEGLQTIEHTGEMRVGAHPYFYICLQKAA